jgi:hypothetical protein
VKHFRIIVGLRSECYWGYQVKALFPNPLRLSKFSSARRQPTVSPHLCCNMTRVFEALSFQKEKSPSSYELRNCSVILPGWGPRQRGRLRHYATSQKVAGYIPSKVTGFFNSPNPSSRNMTLGSTQPLTEMV